MTSEFRQSIKEKAKEKLGSTIDKLRSKSTDAANMSDTSRLGAGGGGNNVDNIPPPSEGANREHLTECSARGAVGGNPASETQEILSKVHKKERMWSVGFPNTKEYICSATDTVSGIAAQHNITMSELKKLNRLMSNLLFPGQVLYVPDEDGSRSETIQVNTPKSSEKTVTITYPETHGPGVAQPSSRARIPSDAEVKRLTDENNAKFVKVSDSKHITDGLGVASGTLLITQNSILFDPKMSDPVVVEMGAEPFGMQCHMESVISVGLYHDIAAIRTDEDPQKSKPKLYHPGEDETEVNSEETFTKNLEKETKEEAKEEKEEDTKEADQAATGKEVPSTPEDKDGVGNGSGDQSVPLRHSEPRDVPSAAPRDVPSAAPRDVPSAAPRDVSIAAQEELVLNVAASASSYGSAAGSLGQSQMVDFSSGIFSVDSQYRGRVKDFEDVTPLTDVRAAGPETKNRTSPDKKDDSEGEIYYLPDRSVPHLWVPTRLFPRPAQPSEGPVFLCVRVGTPNSKNIKSLINWTTIGGTNCIDSKFWFSVPKHQVDEIYAFFRTWKPELYDDLDVSAQERGFIVNSPKDDSDFEVIDDYFTVGHTQHQLSMDWELISYCTEDVAKAVDTAQYHAPELLDTSSIMLDNHVKHLCMSLPARAVGNPWRKVFDTSVRGFSLKSLYRATSHIDNPVLLVVQDTEGQVCGALLSTGPKLSEHFYGTGESFLFTFVPEFKKYLWTGENNFFVKGNLDCLFIGTGTGSFGLWLDSDLYHARTQHCLTFGNDPLLPDEDFICKALEVWCFA